MSDLRMELIQGQLNDIEENVRSIKATWGNTIMMLDNIKSSLKGDRQKAIDEAYRKGFEAGSHEATTLEYQQGLNDAWEAITKIAKMPDGERMTHFGEVWISNILNAYSLEQIFTILQKSEFKPDEIKLPSAQPQRTGYWINKYLHKGNIRECSVCHVTQSVTVYDGKVMFKFCPYCGMKVLESEQRNCHTCKHQVVSSIECVDCRGFGKWEPKEGAE